jgi:hypothetical protein
MVEVAAQSHNRSASARTKAAEFTSPNSIRWSSLCLSSETAAPRTLLTQFHKVALVTASANGLVCRSKEAFARLVRRSARDGAGATWGVGIGSVRFHPPTRWSEVFDQAYCCTHGGVTRTSRPTQRTVSRVRGCVRLRRPLRSRRSSEGRVLRAPKDRPRSCRLVT